LTIKLSAQLQNESLINFQVYSGTFVVNGDKNTFYPVVFRYGNQDKIDRLRIFRSYSEPGPNELSPTHKGGLTLEIDVNFGSWGGSTYNWRIMDLRQSYHETFANAAYAMHYMGFVVWLRGGGFVYHYETEFPSNLMVCYANDLIYEYPAYPQYNAYAPAPTMNIDIGNIKTHMLPVFNNLVELNNNILIGKTSQTNSSYKLDVDGKIRANEIIVNTTGADFVFEPTYKLRTLAELDSFIKANKHLPDISPAKEMQENGISAGEMQVKLLQKVEELSLYLIEKDKEIIALKKEKDKQSEEQEKRNAEFSKEIQELKELIIKMQ
jgi:hypothetical protein